MKRWVARELGRSLQARDLGGRQGLPAWDSPISPAPAPARQALEASLARSKRTAQSAALQPSATNGTPRVMFAVQGLKGGGVEEVVLVLVEGLLARGASVAIAAASESGLTYERAINLNVPVYLAHDARTLRQAVSDFQPDVFNSHQAPHQVALSAIAGGTTYVETVHNWPMAWPDAEKRMFAQRASSATAIVAVSQPVARQLPTIATEKAPPIAVIPNAVVPRELPGIDRPVARAALGVPDDAFLFVSLARFSDQKNTLGLLRAFEQVASARPNGHLLIAGDISDRIYLAHVVRAVEKSSFAGQIHLRDYSPFPEALLLAADAFVLNSFWEASSLASMEALCAGVPAVLSDTGDARSLLGGDPRRGVLVGNPAGPAPTAKAIRTARFDPHQANSDQLRRTLIDVVDNGCLSAERRSALISESLERFGPDRMIEQHLSVLTESASGAPLPRL